jgi:hypothetical protein
VLVNSKRLRPTSEPSTPPGAPFASSTNRRGPRRQPLRPTGLWSATLQSLLSKLRTGGNPIPFGATPPWPWSGRSRAASASPLFRRQWRSQPTVTSSRSSRAPRGGRQKRSSARRVSRRVPQRRAAVAGRAGRARKLVANDDLVFLAVLARIDASNPPSVPSATRIESTASHQAGQRGSMPE